MEKNLENEEFITNDRTREEARCNMWFFFLSGCFLGLIYLWNIISSGKGVELDIFQCFFYISWYVLAMFFTYGVSLDETQSPKIIRMSLIMSIILTISMLIPFILSVGVGHTFVITSGYLIGKDEHLSRTVIEYIDIASIYAVGLMIIWCLVGIVIPMRRLHKDN